MISYNPRHNVFTWHGPFDQRHRPNRGGFDWSPSAKKWYTANPYIAYALRDQLRNGATEALAHVHRNVQASMATEPVLGIACPAGQQFYPFQPAGIEHMANQIRRGRKAVLLADEQGLGKTCQAVGVANELGFSKLLVICPASLRLNWCREIETWHMHNNGVDPVLTGASRPSRKGSIVTSYNLAEHIKDFQPDLVIVDEMHAIKNLGAKRTQLVLGNGDDWRGMVAKAPTVFLSGTPEPNGKPSEIWPALFRTAPDVISYMKYWPFVRRFCLTQESETGEVIILGAKRTRELYTRLRGSGFMTRRLKADVLKDLPPKRYKMVVFPETGGTHKILKKEEAFNAREIMEHGVPVGSALPEIRREMAIEKAPQAIEYIKSMLNGGVQKVVIFGHHVEPLGLFKQALQEYRPVVLIGLTPPAKRQAVVDEFQTNPAVRVFIGNEAAEEGITLTAASDCVLFEPEWVPGKNDQRADRLHRIGQLNAVLVHILVVEKSLDAKILGAAARKRQDVKNTLDGGQ